MAHLKTCPACRVVKGQLEEMKSGFSTMEELTPPEGFAQTVMERVQKTKKSRTRWRALAGLAACAVLCVGLYGTWNLEGRSGAASPSTAASSAEGNGAAADSIMVESMEPETARAIPDTAEDEADSLSRSPSIPVTLGQTPDTPTGQIFDRWEDLRLFLAQFPADDLSDLLETYNESYFESGKLLAVVVTLPAGQTQPQIDLDSLTANQVTVQTQQGGDAPTSWLLVAEVDGTWEGGTVEASLDD
jgi:hypothetical protein